MAKELSRRDFFKLTGLGVGWIAATCGLGFAMKELSKFYDRDPILKEWFDKDNENISFEEASAMALRLDRIADKFDYNPEVSQERMIQWALEVIPMYEYEGAVSKAKFPDQLQFFATDDGQTHNHILGRSNCADVAIVNGRLVNPVSSWYQSEDFLPTVIHELAHVQQGQLCRTEGSENIENTAQIVTWEVLAALANSGNKEAALSLVLELRDNFVSVAFAKAAKDEDLERYMALRQKISPTAIARSRFERGLRVWEGSENERMLIIEKYSEHPLSLVIKAFRDGSLEIPNLALDNQASQDGSVYTYSPEVRPFRVDDLAYFLGHAEEIIDSYLAED